MTKTEKTYMSIIIAILLIAISVIYLYPPIIRHIKCPDVWGKDRSLFVGTNKEIFIKNGENMVLTTEEKQWIRKNCNLEPQYSD